MTNQPDLRSPRFDAESGVEARATEDEGDPYFLAALRSPYYAVDREAPRIDFRVSHVSTQEDWNDLDQLKLEVLRLRDEVIGALAREGEARAQLDGVLRSEARHIEHLAIENHRAVVARLEDSEKRLEAILRSRTWRMVSLLLKPVHLIRRPSSRKQMDET